MFTFVETYHTSKPFTLADNPDIEYYYVDFPKKLLRNIFN